ncbi:MAG: hypothetical protein K1W34_11545 [Lachnospiraceae bacterium]
MTKDSLIAIIFSSLKEKSKGIEEEEYVSLTLTERAAREAERRLRM